MPSLPTTEPFELVARDGLHLRGEKHHPATAAVAMVVLVHGKDEHAGRYGHVIAALTAAGYSVYAQDHRGHGRSDGQRGRIGRFDDYVDDLDLLVERVRQETSSLPLFIIGHSMGGLIAIRYALRRQDRLAGLVLSGAALLVGERVPGWKKRLLTRIARVFPNRPLPIAEATTLSRDPEVQRRVENDPLFHRAPTTLGFAAAVLRAAEETLPRTRELRLPLLIMHGTADQITAPLGSDTCYRLASSTDKTLKRWPDDHHEIFNELDKAAVIAVMLDWLNRHR